MNRRNWLKAVSAVGFASVLPSEMVASWSESDITRSGSPQVETEIKKLQLRHTWTTTMSSSAYRETVHVRYSRDGIVGYGEGAPIIRYKEYPDQAKQAIDSVRDVILSENPVYFDKLLGDVRRRLGENQHAAMSAVDIAMMDWVTKKLNVPLYAYFGLDPADAPVSDFSIGIDTPEITRQKTLEAANYPILKVKVGLNTDEETITAIRSITNKPIRVDANEGWTDKEEAIRKINWLETQGIDLIEQPMPAHMLDETRYVRSKVHLPIIADEACTSASMIPQLINSYDGVNVKLDKAGGILEAYRWIKMARAMNLKVMLGCMVSSSCSCTAAAHLTPLVDYADLDGNLLVSNDPYVGLKIEKGKLILPDGPGLGLRVAQG
jgi:L-alanine-DL-glutamate epimerase-like enolase superfamily enzyme